MTRQTRTELDSTSQASELYEVTGHSSCEAIDSAERDWTLTDPKNLKVKHEFQRLIPLQSKGELIALDESIKQEGCRDPVLVWKGKNIILDGHTRRELCIKHKKQVKVQEVELEDDKAAIEFILQIQRQRRNLSREAVSYFRGSEYNAIKQKRGGDRSSKKAKGQSDTLPPSAERLANKYGVSVKTIKRDGVFAQVINTIADECDDPEIKRRLLSADVKLTHGLTRLLLKQPVAERKASVEKLIEQGEMFRIKKPRVAAAPKPKEVAHSLVARLKAKGDTHARLVLQQMARILGLEVTEKGAGS